MRIVDRVKDLGLPADEFIVFGSGPLEAFGIRETRDVDLFISKALYKQLQASGWEEKPWSREETF